MARATYITQSHQQLLYEDKREIVSSKCFGSADTKIESNLPPAMRDRATVDCRRELSKYNNFDGLQRQLRTFSAFLSGII